MFNLVPFLMLGIVIMAAIGSVLGYLLEPGRFEKNAVAEPAVNPAEAQSEARSPRLAA